MKNITLLLITFFLSYSVKAQKIDLFLNLEVGKTYNQKMLSNIDIKQNVSEQNIQSKLNVGGEISYTVKSITNEIYELEVSYKSLDMKMEVANTNFNFSSGKDDPNDVFSKLLLGIKNKPFTVEMTKKGEVVNVKNLNNLVEGLVNELQNVSEEQKQSLLLQLNKTYGTESFKGSLEGVSLIYPQKSVQIGDKWVTKTKIPSEEFGATLWK